MEMTSPVHAYDDVSMEDFFTQPSQQAIEVTHPRGSESVFINPSALSLTSRQLLLVLCDELELFPDDVFLTALPAKVLLPHLTLEEQTIRPGSKITVQGKLLGSGRSLLQRQIESYFPPPEEAKLPAPDDPIKPTQQTMPGLHPTSQS